MTYAKYINEHTIEHAPVNYAGVSNFNQDTELMCRHGFKELVETARPDDGKMYRVSYAENEDAISMVWEEIVPDPVPEPSYAQLRAVAYPETTEQLDNLYHDIDGGLFGDAAKTSAFYLARKGVKDAYPKAGEVEVGGAPKGETVVDGVVDGADKNTHSTEGYDSLETVADTDISPDSKQVL